MFIFWGVCVISKARDNAESERTKSSSYIGGIVYLQDCQFNLLINFNYIVARYFIKSDRYITLSVWLFSFVVATVEMVHPGMCGCGKLPMTRF